LDRIDSFTKRAFDFSLAIFGLLFFLPLFIFIPIAICLDSGRPVIYLKKSLGKDGKLFWVFKFRSMKNDSQDITRVGSLLRKFAFDELPQLVNIVRGEMSFVGPRPYGVEKYGLNNDFNGKGVAPALLKAPFPDFSLRLQAIPGLTGLGQISCPKHASAEDVFKSDMEYIRIRNLFLDIRIIFISIWITSRMAWESAVKKI
jgi:lipopolysaccharide/colanic/teichoic acid biosynthesis glycosyltransferase